MDIYLGRALTSKGPFYGLFVKQEETLFYPFTTDQDSFFDAIYNTSLNLSKLIKSCSDGPLKKFQYLPPVAPTKILAVGLNYRDHAKEFGQEVPEEPLLFLKPPSAATGHLQPIIYPSKAQRVDYEAELVVIIGKTVRNADKKTASEAILGYTCGNDITERQYQKKDGQWTRAKGFDTFAPFGPWIATSVNPEEGLSIKLFLNGELKQQSNTLNMLFTPVDLVAFASQIMTLYPGDIIFTGTPSGVGPLNPGDEVQVWIENIGSLVNFVIKE
jgi:2-keto-4-pentenoate hydratase/2-oxohepta-3-ene-1,7-dioic acid hydratase in catechol pathway